MDELTKCTVEGETYDAADDKGAPCRGCAGEKNRHACCRLPPCSPANGRTDGRFVIWIQRPRIDRGGLQLTADAGQGERT